MKISQETRGKLLVLSSFFLFGTLGLFVRYIPLPSSVIANVRGIVGTLFLLIFLALRKQKLHFDAIRRNLKYLLPAGMVLGFNWLLLFEAYRYTTVAVATVFYYLAPVFVLLLSPIFLKEKLTGKRSFFAFLALVGMVLTSGVVQNGFQASFTGVILATGAACMYAAIVLLNKKLKDISSLEVTVVQLAISAVVLLPYNLLTVVPEQLACDLRGLILLMVVSIVHTGICYAMYFSALPLLTAQTAALYSYIDPIVAILLSALLLHEPMDIYGAVGAILVLGSTALSELTDSRKNA